MRALAEQLIGLAGRHRRAVMLGLLLPGLLAGLSLFRIRFTNDVSQLFPDGGDASAAFRVLNETKLGNTVQLEFLCSGPVEKHEKYLDAAAEKIARLPGVKNLVFRYREADAMGEMETFTGLLPRFYGPEILKECGPETAVRSALKQLAFPVPGGVKRVRNQPFGLEMKILSSLRTLDLLTGMKLAYDVPYFATQDRRRAMMVFDADIVIGDAGSVRELLAGIRDAAAPLPPGMEYRVISGAMHTLGNEEVLKRDAAVSGTVSLLLFLLIFLIFYRRDWRALWIPAIPLYASLLSLGIMTLFFREICLYVVGLGSCVTGLAVDQGIHVYSACRGENAAERTAALTEPMVLSALTSILVFVFLALTGVRAYVQLAVFAGLSLAFSCLVALIVRSFVSPLPFTEAWLFVVGFTLGLHVCFTLRAILQEQPDLQEYGYVFSYVLIWIFNVAGVIAWIVCTSEVTWSAVWARLVVRSTRAYAAVGRGCLWIYESVRTLPFLQG